MNSSFSGISTGGGTLDPLAELKLSRENGKSVTRVHFANRKLTSIHSNFQYLVNLEVLWLNDNQLKKVENLVPADYGDNSCDIADRCHNLGCLRLRSLYLSNNSIATLSGDLRHLRFLEVLLLSNNRLSNMELVSSFLKHLHFLKQLDLFGNPLTEEMNYREYFIHNHPSVQVLDRKSVEEEERVVAKRMFSQAIYKGGKPAYVAFGSSIPMEHRNMTVRKHQPMSQTVFELERSIQKKKDNAVRAEHAALKAQRLKEEEEIEARKRLRAPSPDTESIIQGKHLELKQQIEQNSRADVRNALLRGLLTDTQLQQLNTAYSNVAKMRRDECLAVCDCVDVRVTPAISAYIDNIMNNTSAVTLATVLDQLLDSREFVEQRLEGVAALANDAIMKGKDAQAKRIHKSMNDIHDHLSTLS